MHKTEWSKHLKRAAEIFPPTTIIKNDVGSELDQAINAFLPTLQDDEVLNLFEEMRSQIDQIRNYSLALYLLFNWSLSSESKRVREKMGRQYPFKESGQG